MLLAICNACIDPDAELAFHAARFPNECGQSLGSSDRRRCSALTEPKLRQYLVSNYYVDKFEFHTLFGRELIPKFGHKACPRSQPSIESDGGCTADRPLPRASPGSETPT